MFGAIFQRQLCLTSVVSLLNYTIEEGILNKYAFEKICLEKHEMGVKNFIVNNFTKINKLFILYYV